jgi:hypothetical protein
MISVPKIYSDQEFIEMQDKIEYITILLIFS